MTSYSNATARGFYRDADCAVIGGVCAGLARYFGLNLKVTRILAFIAFLTAMPFAVIGYLAAVMLIPAESGRGDDARETRWGLRRSGSCRRARRAQRRAAKHSVMEEPAAVATGPSLKDVKERYKSLDQRLAELEKQVTSPRFQLEQEFRKL
ncbi:MAG: PspC domain-containing protein [Woeseiaceae bacterium]